MFGLTRKPFAVNKKPNRTPTFKPQIEALERREVPSASSPAMHAVAPPAGHPTQQNYFYIDEQTHLLKLNSLTLNGTTNTPSGVQSLSAGHDRIGFVDVFVTAGDGSFWRWNEGNWTKLLGPDVVKSFAAVDGGRVYAIFQDNTLHEFDSSNWLLIPGSGSVKAIDAVTTKSNTDGVFALNTDGSFWDYVQIDPGSAFLSDKLYGSGRYKFSRITDFSAGFDSSGNPEVYATFTTLLGTANLYKIRAGSSESSWSFVAAGSTFKAYSATTDGAVWVIGSDGSVYEYDQYSHKQNELGSFASATSISAASSTDVYFVSSDHKISEWVDSPNVGWELFSGLGASQQ
jgi:hypothetical protein